MPTSLPDIDWGSLERSFDLGGLGQGDQWLTDANIAPSDNTSNSPTEERQKAQEDVDTPPLEEVKDMLSLNDNEDNGKSKIDKIKEQYEERPYIVQMGRADIILILHKKGFGPKEIADTLNKKLDTTSEEEEVSPEDVAAHLKSIEDREYEYQSNPLDVAMMPSTPNQGGDPTGGVADRITTTSLITNLRKTARSLNFRGNFKIAGILEKLANLLE